MNLRRKINLGNKLASNFTHEIFFFSFLKEHFHTIIIIFPLSHYRQHLFKTKRKKPGGKKSSVFETE